MREEGVAGLGKKEWQGEGRRSGRVREEGVAG